MKRKLETHPILGFALGSVFAGTVMVAAVGGVTAAVVLPLSIFLGL